MNDPSTGSAPYTAEEVAPPDQPEGTVRLPAGADFATAKEVARLWDSGLLPGYGAVRRHRGEWLEYVRGVYRPVPDQRLVDRLYRFCDHAAFYVPPTAKAPGEWKAWAPSRRKVSDLVHALAAALSIHHAVEPGGMLDGSPAGAVLNVQNGLLDLTRGVLHPHTPQLFSTVQSPARYDPSAPAPLRWLRFLDEVFAGDQESIKAVQAWAGYVLSGRTHLQRALFIRGERRSGKGTIARVLTHLVGPENVAAPTAAAFSTNFGLQGLVGKSLAISPDLRAKAGGQEEFVERVLSITGEDVVMIDRKHREPWSGRIGARLMFLSNDPPGVVDSSGALASRFILLETRGSWLGREDLGLESALLAELSGILSWALDGYAHVAGGGRIIEPAASAALRADVDDLGSGEGAFLRECCEVDPEHEDDVTLLHATYVGWRRTQGQRDGKAKRRFSADLRGRVGGAAARKSNGRTIQPGVRVRDDLPDEVRRAARDALGIGDVACDDPRLRCASFAGFYPPTARAGLEVVR